MNNSIREYVLNGPFIGQFSHDRMQLEKRFPEHHFGHQNHGFTLLKIFQFAVWHETVARRQ